LTFDYYVAHPQQLRVWAWEEAEGWKTLKMISSQIDHSDVDQLLDLLDRAHRAGLLRPDLSPHVVMYVLINLFRTYHTSLPLFQLITPEDLSSPESLARARDEIVAFIVHGLIADPSRSADQNATGCRASLNED
jgi:TetR/AcrR family transcriptional regulator